MRKSILKEDTLFLDSCVFFTCIKEEQYRKILDRAINQNFKIVTSITVLGETLTEMLRQYETIGNVDQFISLLKEWNVITLYPNDVLSQICFEMGLDTADTRITNQITDRVHLGYAISYDCNYFITDDDAIQRYRIPTRIEKIDYHKPDTLDLLGLRDTLQRNQMKRK